MKVAEWPYPIKIACNWPEETSRLLALTLSTVENSNFARLCWPCQKIPFISRSMAVYPVRDVRVSSPKMFQRLVKWHKRGQLFCAFELHSCTWDVFIILRPPQMRGPKESQFMSSLVCHSAIQSLAGGCWFINHRRWDCVTLLAYSGEARRVAGLITGRWRQQKYFPPKPIRVGGGRDMKLSTSHSDSRSQKNRDEQQQIQNEKYSNIFRKHPLISACRWTQRKQPAPICFQRPAAATAGQQECWSDWQTAGDTDNHKEWMEARCEGRQRATGCKRTIPQTQKMSSRSASWQCNTRKCVCVYQYNVRVHWSAHTRCQATIFMKMNEHKYGPHCWYFRRPARSAGL